MPSLSGCAPVKPRFQLLGASGYAGASAARPAGGRAPRAEGVIRFELDAQSEMPLSFEGSGVDTTWEMRMPKAANFFDYYRTIVDVLRGIRSAFPEEGIPTARKPDKAKSFLGIVPLDRGPNWRAGRRCLKLPRFRGVLASLVDYAPVGWTSIACS